VLLARTWIWDAMKAQSSCDIVGCPSPGVVRQVASFLGSPLSAPTRCVSAGCDVGVREPGNSVLRDWGWSRW
jgi:hypothetical protein